MYCLCSTVIYAFDFWEKVFNRPILNRTQISSVNRPNSKKTYILILSTPNEYIQKTKNTLQTTKYAASNDYIDSYV